MGQEREEVWKKSICGICPAGCWVEARVEDGKLTGIRADLTHPLGMLCRRGEHAQEIVYSDKRLRFPMRRRGPKGTYDFERISWDEAYDAIVLELNRLKAASGPEAVAVYTGRGAFEMSLCDIFQPKGVAVSSASSILFPFGSPNTMGVGALCYVSFAMIAPHVTFGRMLINMFTDLENAELILVWGANPATDSPPLDMARLESAARRGAKIVLIDPRRTETARRCGAEWIPIRPGTDGALALSLAQVMIEEDLYDERFVTSWTHGFEEFRSYVQHFTPEKVFEITGVPAARIRELARQICAANGCAPVMYTGLEYSNSGIQAIRAVLTIWAMAGQLDVPGGLGLAVQGTHFPINRSCNVENPNLSRAVARDRFPLYSHYRGESHASGLIDAVLHGKPYPIRGLLVHGASLLTSWPQTPIWREALSRLDFMVCIDRQLTADAAYADILLPATTMFEIQSYMAYGPIFRIRERLIEPVGEARNDYLIMAELARRLGYGDRYPQSEDELLEFVLHGSGHDVREVREAGGWIQASVPVMEYRKWEKGGLRSDGKPGFDTPTGKFEISSTVLKDFGYEPLPKYVEPTEGPIAAPEIAERFPLVFNSGARIQTDFRSQHHGIEGLVKDSPEPVVEINADDAASRGIRDGDRVEVVTPRGAVEFRASVTVDIVRGAVECNMGGGSPVGPQAWRNSNVNELTDLGNADEISGFPVYKALLCDVRRKGEAREVKPRAPRAEADSGAVAVTVSAAALQRVYLDHNASTPMLPGVEETMRPYLSVEWGNPSSIHSPGRRAHQALEEARRRIAQLIGAKPRRIVFTGGGSEADNLAIKGVAFARAGTRGHFITSAIEHPAVLQSCRFLEALGNDVTYLPVDRNGMVTPDELRRALRKDTVLVSIMTANNEVGTIQPVAELCAVAHEHGALFHTDAVQAAGRLSLNAEELGVDLLSISAHKIGGPKGVGALYVRKDLTLCPLIHGGHQESGLRAGTENVAGIVGFGKAAELAVSGLIGMERTRALRDRLEAGISEIHPEARLNGHPERRLPNTLNMTLPGIRGESLVIALDQRGISISSGSACKSGSPEPTHVLLSMGRPPEEAHCAVRLSLSSQTSQGDIDRTLGVFRAVLKEMATTVRFLPCK